MDKRYITEDLGLSKAKDYSGEVYFYPDEEDFVGFFLESEDKSHFVFIPSEPIDSLSNRTAFEKIFR